MQRHFGLTWALNNQLQKVLSFSLELARYTVMMTDEVAIMAVSTLMLGCIAEVIEKKHSKNQYTKTGLGYVLVGCAR